MTSPLPLPETALPGLNSVADSTYTPAPGVGVRDAGHDPVLYGLTALLMFAPLAFGAVEPWAIFAFEAASALLFGYWAFQQLAAGSMISISVAPVFAPMGLFLALLVLQLLPGISAYRHATSSALWLYIAYGLVSFLVAQSLRRTTQVGRLATAMISFGAALAVFAILQSLSSKGKLYWSRTPTFGGWIYGPYVNHNHYAGLMEMLAPIALVFAFSRYAHGRKKWFAAAAAALMASTIFLSGSRGGMGAFAAQIALFLWLAFRERTRDRTALLLSGFLLMSVAFVAWIGGNEVSARLATIGHQHEDLSLQTRMTLSFDTLRMAAKRPFLGWGIGTFQDVYPQFRSFYTDKLVDKAHNDYVQLLAETGIVGGAIAFWFILAVFVPAIRKVRNWTSDVNGAVGLAAMLGVFGILVHSLVDFNLQIPANAMLFYVLCTIASMDTAFRTHRQRNQKSEQFRAAEDVST